MRAEGTPSGVIAFIVAQVLGALAAVIPDRWFGASE
jgi:hypothetical protein